MTPVLSDIDGYELVNVGGKGDHHADMDGKHRTWFGDEYDGRLHFIDIVILAACLCSSDTVAPLTFIDSGAN